ncbi:MAG: efflux RND transporter permease subunit [Chakrabartia sp.]
MNITDFAVRRWQLTLVGFILVCLLRVNSLLSIPRSVDPYFPIPFTIVTAVLPGADAADVEETVAKPIETVLQGLDNVRDIRSTTSDGLAVITVEFEYGTDSEQALDRTVREVNGIRPQLPAGLARLEMRRPRTTESAVVQLAVVSKGASWRRMEKYAQDINDRLAVVPGVRAVSTFGMATPEVRVALNTAKLAEARIPAAAVAAAVAGGGADVPAGAVDSGGRRFNVKAGGAFRSLDDVRAVPLRGGNGQLVTVGEVADVRWAEAEHLNITRYNGERAVFITVRKKDKTDTIRLRESLGKSVEAARATLPPDMKLEIAFDQSGDIERKLGQLGIDFAIALALVLITLLPLGFRASLVVMISIPTSLAIGIISMNALGYSLNQISISGFIVALGLLVDDSIVVTENIERHLRMGAARAEAAIRGTKEITMAVLGSTGVLLFAFLPVANLPETSGDFVRGLPMAVLVTVSASLIVSLTIVPFVASRILEPHQTSEGNQFLCWLQEKIERFYKPLLHWALENPHKSLWSAMGACFLAFAAVPILGFSLFPKADAPYFVVRIEAPEGSGISKTDAIVRRMAQRVQALPEVDSVMENSGRGNPQIYYNNIPREFDPSYGELFVTLKKWSPRESPAFIAQLRDDLSRVPDAQVSVIQFDQGPPIEAPIAIRVRGPDLAVLKRLSGEIADVMRTTPGTRDVKDPLAIDRIDLNLQVDQEKAGLLNVAPDAVKRTMRLAISGERASAFRDAEGDSYPVTVRLPLATSQPISALDSIYVSSQSGGSVPLSQVTRPELDSAPSKVNRYKLERAVTVSSFVTDGSLPSKVNEAVVARLAEIKLPPGYVSSVGGEAEVAARNNSGLGGLVLLAVFGILAVLVAEFGRFREVAVVAGVIPLGLFGGLVALLLTGNSLSFLAVIGFVALIGIEIKNSILLVDFTTQLRQRGLGLRDAIEQAGEIRFLPVLLTSVTAIGGLLPLALSGSQLYSPLAWVIIGGLISSTFLSRIVTPVMYLLIVRGAEPPAVRTDAEPAPAA